MMKGRCACKGKARSEILEMSQFNTAEFCNGCHIFGKQFAAVLADLFDYLFIENIEVEALLIDKGRLASLQSFKRVSKPSTCPVPRTTKGSPILLEELASLIAKTSATRFFIIEKCNFSPNFASVH